MFVSGRSRPMRKMQEKTGEAIAFFRSAELWTAVVACGFLVLIFLGIEHALGILSARRVAAFSLLYTLILTGIFLALRSANWVVANLFFGAVAAFVYVAAVTGWLIKDIYSNGRSFRRFAYIVFNDNWSEANEYLMRHGRWYQGVLVVLPLLAFFGGFLIFKRLESRRRRIQLVTGALLVPVGLVAGLQPKVKLVQPLQEFYTVIALQRADVRFMRTHLGRLEFPAAGKRSFPVKAWVHRTDSVEKLDTLFAKFGGFELDVVFHLDGGYFDVTHPPVPSIGLTLDKYFASQPAIATKYFWLDFKNLSDDDADMALRTLSAIADRFKIKDHLIVESPRPDLLVRFSHAGFYTSFYLPEKGARREEEWLKEITSKLAGGYVDAISTTEEQYRVFRKTHFFDYDVLLWNLEDAASDQADPRVKVLLFEQHTRFER